MGEVHESGNYQGFDLVNTHSTKVLQRRRVKLLYEAVAVHCVIKNIKKLHKMSKGQVHQHRLDVSSLFAGLPHAAHVQVCMENLAGGKSGVRNLFQKPVGYYKN